MGDHVVVINASQIKLTGQKWQKKLYRWHTGYPGGLKERNAADMHARKPTEILKQAVFGMLRRTNLRDSYLAPRLKIYAGNVHPHTAQLPPAVEPLPKCPKQRRGNFHFGLKYYAHPQSHLDGRVSRSVINTTTTGGAALAQSLSAE
jgi:hypothetical protein